MLETVVGFVALGISIFAVAISIVFYFKSDNLYKEMLKFITEIRTYSVGMYKDTFGMVKEAWPYGRQKGGREKISQETIKEKEKIKEEITKDIMTEITKIKEISTKGIQTDQLKKEMASLEQKFKKTMAEAFGKIEALDRKKERISLKLDDIDKEIISIMKDYYPEGIETRDLVDIVSRQLPIPQRYVADFVTERIMTLRKKKQLDFKGAKLTAFTTLKIKK